jgi:hypothetical protein
MAYRNLEQHLEQRRVSLDGERQELDAELERLDQVRRRRSEISTELSELDSTLAQVANRRHLAVLSQIRVAKPCKARWESMAGDERVRFCRQCSKHVYNLSAMTSEEAAALVYEKEGKLCTRYFRRADGTVLTSDCPVGVRKRRRLKLAAFGVAAAGLAGACSLHLGAVHETVGELEAMPSPPTMGSIAVPLAPAPVPPRGGLRGK